MRGLDWKNAIKRCFNILPSISFVVQVFRALKLQTIDKVPQFILSPRLNCFLVGQRSLSPLPSLVFVTVYTSSAYSVRMPSAGSHIPIRVSHTAITDWTCEVPTITKLHIYLPLYGDWEDTKVWVDSRATAAAWPQENREIWVLISLSRSAKITDSFKWSDYTLPLSVHADRRQRISSRTCKQLSASYSLNAGRWVSELEKCRSLYVALASFRIHAGTPGISQMMI